MKRTLSLILAILMVVTIFATVGMAEDEPEAAGEPETVETAAPAAEGPAAPVEEAPAEPAPAAEPEVVPASEPAAEPVAEPNAEPATISEEPADNGIAPVSEPAPTAITDVGWVELDCNGGSYLGYARHTADVFDGNLHSGIKPVRDGYEFVGWYKDKASADNPDKSQAIHDGESIQGKERETLYAGWKPIPEPTKPPETTDNYKYGVWLTVVNGDFKDSNAGKASVWVEFTEGTRKLPEVGLPTATRSNGEFKGWYTAAPTEVLENGYWKTTAYNGQEVGAGQPVPEGVQVLYAAFKDKDQKEESEKLVTFYLHPNGMGGSNGALQVTRPYDEDVDGVKFTAENAAVYGINLSASHTDEITGSDDQAKWKALKKIWEEELVNGYKFLGWYTAKGKLVDGEKETPTVKNGDHLYAHWSLNGETHVTTPTPAPTPGQVETIRIDAPHMTVRMDPNKTQSVTVSAFVTPVGGSHDGITWTVEVPPTVSENNYADLFKPSQVYTINGSKIDKAKDKNGVMATDDPKFTAKAEGLTLTITPNPGCSQVLYVSAECNGKTTPAPATVIIEHAVSEVKTVVRAATCTAAGEEGFVCAECGEVTDAETLPATGHSFCGHATCEVCGEAGKKGDPSGDGAIDTSDVRVLFLAAMNDGEGVAPEIGDVTGDGVIDTSDVRVLFLAAMNDGSLPG